MKEGAFPSWIAGGSLVAMCVLTWAQWLVLRDVSPSPDTIQYFDMADQLRQVGYPQALSGHWSPLFAAYVALVQELLRLTPERELPALVGAYGVLIVGAFAAGLVLLRAVWPPSFQSRLHGRLWVGVCCSWAGYLLLVHTRVNLLLPDALIFLLLALGLTCWVRAFRDGRVAWVAAAGLLCGVAYLARTYVFWWSLATGLLAVALLPRERASRRAAALALFVAGMLAVALPHAAALSQQKGRWTFGDAGRQIMVETFGARWESGGPTWPLVAAEGDLRVYADEARSVSMPGFYEPGREFWDATVEVRIGPAIGGAARAVQAYLFGYWSSARGLIWPTFWITWPLLLGFRFRRRESHSGEPAWVSGAAWLLIGAGAIGVGMHLVSSCLDYYLPFHLFAAGTGAYLLLMARDAEVPSDGTICRAARIAAPGLLLFVILWTAALYRDATRGAIAARAQGRRALVAALQAIESPRGEPRRLAVLGHWLGLYEARLSGSQIYAEVTTPEATTDPARWREVVQVMREHGIVGILAPPEVVRCGPPSPWRRVENTPWALARLGARPGPESSSRGAQSG